MQRSCVSESLGSKRLGVSDRIRILLFGCVVVLGPFAMPTMAADPPTKETVRAALKRATTYMSETIADHGGYAWVSSVDGKLSHGEGACDDDRVWVQPPGTPAVGEAYLRAFKATGDAAHMRAAINVAKCLFEGQLASGGWGYSIDFAPEVRANIPYLEGVAASSEGMFRTPEPGGWEIWRQRKFKHNKTVIDDDTTSAALSFSLNLLETMSLSNMLASPELIRSVSLALQSTRLAQYPIGAWSHHYDRMPTSTPSVEFYPIVDASYPDDWSRTWTKDYNGCYMLNDNITQNMIRTMLLAWRITKDERYRDTAIRGGEFLLRAQMPEPQPAWAQQYDRNMHPVWDRKFEPPAIAGYESQTVLETLLDLYDATQDERFLEPIQPAIAYLRTCLRPDGRLPRYSELKTNQPLYFNLKYELTSDDSEMPDHYGFVGDSRLDKIERRYRSTVEGTEEKATTVSADRVAKILAAQHEDGGWREPGFVRDPKGRKVVPDEGVIHSATFIKNVGLLCDHLMSIADSR
ncbi:pectate lyase [Rhodopirellula sp. JC740]|uniref:Pectate lyase n=2 Tax=Rhodopirellula halodulae TaxID=2894198 RepID=A0ABS8NG67_9BACT|nr:pectate lyase [Rhodopirellula sp. JC740]MCC9641848.1 pectate lyase [Rhodopirellula sp. JC740]